MPRTRSLAWSELKIGLVSIVAIVVATTLIFLLSGQGGFFWQRYRLKTIFSNVAGVSPGAPVRVAGIEVGSVEDVQLSGDRVEVVMKVSKDMRSRITYKSIAQIGSVSLLGEGAVDITPASNGTPIPEWGYVPAAPPSASLADVQNQASQGLEQLSGLLADMRAGKGTLGQLAANKALYDDLDALLVSVNQVTRTVTSSRGTIGRLMNDPAAAKSLEASLANLQMITARIQEGQGSLGKFMTDDRFHDQLVATTSNINTLTGRMNSGDGTMGQLMTNRQLFDRFNSTADRMDKLMAGLNAGEGTAGQLLRDKQMYDNLNKTIASVNDLVAAIKADPKKYLNVRVSLF
jgi:phospholipid/cholesterol/gamma-HCH transport system substrate-binding protein